MEKQVILLSLELVCLWLYFTLPLCQMCLQLSLRCWMFWSSVGTDADVGCVRPGCDLCYLTCLCWWQTRWDAEQRPLSKPSNSLHCTDCLAVGVWFTALPMNIWILKSGPSEQRTGLKKMEEITVVSGSLILYSVMKMSRQEAVMFSRWSVTERHILNF